MTTLENVHEDLHEQEALGLSKALSKHTTVEKLYPSLTRLILRQPNLVPDNRTLPFEPAAGLSDTSSLVDTPILVLDDAAASPLANLVSHLLEGRSANLEETI